MNLEDQEVMQTADVKICPHNFVFIFACADCRTSERYAKLWEEEQRRRKRVLDSLTRKLYLRSEEDES